MYVCHCTIFPLYVCVSLPYNMFIIIISVRMAGCHCDYDDVEDINDCCDDFNNDVHVVVTNSCHIYFV